MPFKSAFDLLPNELYLSIFDYLNPIDLHYSFSNLNRRINYLLKSYSRFPSKYIDLTKLNPNVFKYYCLEKKLNNQINSLKLNDQQLKLFKNRIENKIIKLNLFLFNEFHLNSNDFVLFEYLEKLTIENNPITWQKPFVNCIYLKQVNIHLKNHQDLIQLINHLPIVEQLHVIIDYDVSTCRDNIPLKCSNISNRLTDFSYMIEPRHGLVYFVTDYSIIESLIKQLTNLSSLRLYIIGCMNTIVDGTRLENNLLKNLFQLNELNLFIQSYGGKAIKSMDQFKVFKWNFGSYSNDLTDMHFLFTLPFQFQRLDECINQYFIQGIRTTFTKSKDAIENEKLFGLNNIKHVDLSCSITENLLILLRDSFQSLESIRFTSSTAEYKSPPSLVRQSRFYLKSIRRITFDHTCRNQSPFIRLLPNLNKLIVNQKLLTHLLEETGDGYCCQVTHLEVHSFQRHSLEDIINAFTNLRHLILKTTLSDDEGPVRSFLDGRCHHKHRPVSITDVLDDLLKSQLYKLKQIQVGCYFERDEENIQPILSRVIRKHRGENYQFHINSEDFKSTRCGTVEVLFF